MRFDLPHLGEIEILVYDRQMKEFVLRQFSNYIVDVKDRKIDFKDNIALIYTNLKFLDTFLYEEGTFSRTFKCVNKSIHYENIVLEESKGNMLIKVRGRKEHALRLKRLYYKGNKRREHAKYHAMFYRVVLFPIFALYAITDGYFLIHGSLLSYKGHNFVVSGLDGVGKTSLTTKLCKCGANVLADNFVIYNGRDFVPLLMPLRVESNLHTEEFETLYDDNLMKEIVLYNGQRENVRIEKIFLLSITEKFHNLEKDLRTLDWVMFLNNAPEICDANRFIGPFLLQRRKIGKTTERISINELGIPRGELDEATKFITDLFDRE